ncbi:MAG TPA: hypothetical protein VHL50_06265 [Pyrinomonadaceae bacterium]|nr:hypothetical protein [Pyrinomonadaceae bacterium]
MTHDDANSFYSQPAASPTAVSEDELIKRAVLRLNGNVLGIVIGTLGALVIFVATNWLVMKGGEVVGPHMGLLDQFFYGYSVTFVGSLIGAAYVFVLGYLCGLLIGWIYNAVLLLRGR